LPEPVLPQTMTTGCAATVRAISSRFWLIGSARSKWIGFIAVMGTVARRGPFFTQACAERTMAARNAPALPKYGAATVAARRCP